MKWTRSTDTSMRCEPWTICKVWLNGIAHYELWHDKQPHAVGSEPSFEKAKELAESIELAGQA